MRPCRGRGGGVRDVTRLNLKMSHVSVYPFFVAYSQLRSHCHNFAGVSCLLWQFHFTLCRYFLGHVTCWNLPWQGLNNKVMRQN